MSEHSARRDEFVRDADDPPELRQERDRPDTQVLDAGVELAKGVRLIHEPAATQAACRQHERWENEGGHVVGLAERLTNAKA